MTGFMETLHAQKPNERLAAKLALYGQFVGSWTLDIDYDPPGGARISAPGEWHFGWVLDGKAVQDRWMFPSRSYRVGKPVEPWHRDGTTLRWYDPMIDAWHINYIDAGRPYQIKQIARAVGNDIVQTQIGGEASGVARRWRFTDISKDAFRWIGDITWDKGATWTCEMEMRARRAG